MKQVEIQEVKLASKQGALVQIGRHLGMFNDKLTVSVAPLDERFAEAMAKVEGGDYTIQPPDPNDPTIIDGELADDEDDEFDRQQPELDDANTALLRKLLS